MISANEARAKMLTSITYSKFFKFIEDIIRCASENGNNRIYLRKDKVVDATAARLIHTLLPEYGYRIDEDKDCNISIYWV